MRRLHGRPRTANKWCRVDLAEDGRAVVNAERDGHPDAHVWRKMLFLWSCHCRADRLTAARVTYSNASSTFHLILPTAVMNDNETITGLVALFALPAGLVRVLGDEYYDPPTAG